MHTGVAMAKQRFLTVDEVADLLRVSVSTVYDLTKRSVDDPKRIPAYKLGGATRIAEDELEAYIKRNAMGKQST
jgi:excisionase family DNA binding protein